MCPKCAAGQDTTPDFVERNGTVTFRRCQCGTLHVRHYDGYWWTCENGYNLDIKLGPVDGLRNNGD